MIHVVPTVSQEADGVANVVWNLCESMIASGIDLHLAALEWAKLSAHPDYLRLFQLGWGPSRIGASPQMQRWLKAEVDSGTVDVIHNHGMWMMPNVYAANVCINTNCRLMFSPHGTMSVWALGRSAFLKQVFWKLLQGPAARVADCFHATAESEYLDIRRLGFKQPVCIISNGVNLQLLEQKQTAGRRQLLFLGRIHPIKGIDNLLHAWHAVEDRFPDWDLHVAGPDAGGYLDEMQSLAEKLRLKRVVFRGALYGEEKLKAYRAASLYVLPTHTENFGITVAEALAAGTPAIVTHGAPWVGLAEQGAGWWIEVGAASLVECLEVALSTSPKRLMEMGKAGHDWMARDFSWSRKSAQFLETYRWLIEGGEPPSWVRLD